MIYLETTVLGEPLIGAAVDQPVLRDPSLRGLVDALDAALACPDDALEAEVRLAGSPSASAPPWGSRRRRRATPVVISCLAEQLRAWLDERTFDAPTMAAAAAALDADPTRLARAFATVFAIPPHAYVDGRRLEAARGRILAGTPRRRRRRGRVRGPGPPHATLPSLPGHHARALRQRSLTPLTPGSSAPSSSG